MSAPETSVNIFRMEYTEDMAAHVYFTGGHRPSLAAVVAPSVLLHGIFDYSLSALQAVDARLP